MHWSMTMFTVETRILRETMATILFYSPFNQRSRDTESLMIAFQKQGHKVMSLSQQEGLQINDFLNSHGITASSYVIPGERSGWRYYLKHLIFFIRFCRKHKIEIVYSHLEPANFVASIGQYFIKARTFLCRHHINEGKLYQFDKDLYYRLTYRLAKKIIVVSDQARRYMIEYEGIPAHKVIHINLAYSFHLYLNPDQQRVEVIRKQHRAEVLLSSACRFTVSKRPDQSILTVKKLVDQGIDAKLILLGKGEMHDDLERQIVELNLQNRVFMPGYVSNVLEHMAATDFFLHPSLMESSCVVVKEAGLVNLPVIVCKGVGDFDEYILHGENGFIAEKDNFAERAASVILTNFRKQELLKTVGANLKKSVLRLFSIEHVIEQYSSLNRIP